MTNTEIAKKVIEALGGVENINSVAVRLAFRVMVKSIESIIDKMLSKILKKYRVPSLTLANTKSSLVQVLLTKFTTKSCLLSLPTSTKS